MSNDTSEPFLFPAVGRKKVIADFDGGRLTSDGGVMLLAAAERRLGIADRLAGLIADPRNPLFVTHSVADILRARMLAIACGYEDADDLDHLRTDPGFKLACGRLPDSGHDLCSQPTVSRWENAPSLREVVRLTYAMVDTYCASYSRPPKAVTLDIDDTVDVAHGHQQLALFNAHHDERCFMPIHVYDIATSRPVAVLLRPGKTPSGFEVRSHVRRLVRRIRKHWPDTRLTLRGDGHYGRPEVMAWCEANAVDYIFGLPGNAVLSRLLEEAADESGAPKKQRRCCAAMPRSATAPSPGAASAGSRPGSRPAPWGSTCCVVTNLGTGSANGFTTPCIAPADRHLQVKGQLASDRAADPHSPTRSASCCTLPPTGMLAMRDAIPKPQPLATAEFTTLRLRLLKIAGRITETATRVRALAGVPRSRAVPWRRAQPPARRTMTAGAIGPGPAPSRQPQRPALSDRNRDETSASSNRVRRSACGMNLSALNRMG